MSRLLIAEDYAADQGHALITLEGAGPGEDARFRLVRPGAELPNLGPAGWQSEPHLLTPREVRRSDGAAVLVVGPEIVDWLSVDARVRIEADGLGFAGEAYWPDISPSAGGPAAAYVEATRPEVTPKAAVPPKPPASPPEPLAKEVDAGLAEVAATFEAQDDATGSTDPPAKNKRLAPIAGALLALVLVVGGAVGLYVQDPFGWFAPTATVATTTAPPQEAPAVAPEPTPVAACSEAVFADLVTQGADLAAWQAAAEGCRDVDDVGAYTAALDSCVAAGTPACLYQMGRCYDPRHAEQIRCAPGEPSTSIAIDYYTRAEEARVTAAAAERAALCEVLEAEDAEEAFLAGCL